MLPWEVFFAGYFAAMIGALVWLTGRTWLVLLAFPPIPLELYHGNIHLFMAVAIVVGFRYPMAWAFIVLTKVSPGVGALWFAFRARMAAVRDRGLLDSCIAGISYVIAPDLWRQYVSTMVDNLEYDPGHPYPVPIPLPIRMALSVAVVWWGARTDRRWTVPVAATISLPIIWFHGLALLVAAIPLWREDRIRRAAQAGAGGGSNRRDRRSPRREPPGRRRPGRERQEQHRRLTDRVEDPAAAIGVADRAPGSRTTSAGTAARRARARRARPTTSGGWRRRTRTGQASA